MQGRVDQHRLSQGVHLGPGRRPRAAWPRARVDEVLALADGRRPVDGHPVEPGVEPQLVDRGVELRLVGSELLQRPHPAPCADDRHEIAGLHLLIHELVQRLTNLDRAAER